MDNDKQAKLKALRELQNQEPSVGSDIPNEITTPSVSPVSEYTKVDRDLLPYMGIFYPKSWLFAVRKPDVSDVAAFSVLNDKNRVEVLAATEELIRKCVVIYDSETETTIDSGEINEPEKLWWMLLLRRLYIINNPITWEGLCDDCTEMVNFWMDIDTIQYPDIKQKTIDAFDGRAFHFVFEGIDEPIVIRMPSVARSSKIFKHVVRTLKDSEKNGKTKSTDKLFSDKRFLLFAPWLFETGDETMIQLIAKYNRIIADKTLFEKYNILISKMEFDNTDSVVCECSKCRSLEVGAMKFPGGWRKFFIGDTCTEGYF